MRALTTHGGRGVTYRDGGRVGDKRREERGGDLIAEKLIVIGSMRRIDTPDMDHLPCTQNFKQLSADPMQPPQLNHGHLKQGHFLWLPRPAHLSVSSTTAISITSTTANYSTATSLLILMATSFILIATSFNLLATSTATSRTVTILLILIRYVLAVMIHHLTAYITACSSA